MGQIPRFTERISCYSNDDFFAYTNVTRPSFCVNVVTQKNFNNFATVRYNVYHSTILRGYEYVIN